MTGIYDAHAYLGNHPAFAKSGLPVPLDGAGWVDVFDRSGVDGALVAPPGIGVGEDFKPDMELIAQAIEAYPGRFFGFARFRPRRGKAVPRELRYWVRERGFHAIKMNTLDDDYTLTDRDLLDPIIQEAGRLGIPVFMHTGDESGATCTPTMVADIAVDYPDNTFIIGHMGHPGWTEELIPAMNRAPNTVTETEAVFIPGYIQDVVDAVGAERVLMGSNAPYTPIELPRIVIGRHMGRLSESQKEAIMGRNLLRVLGVEG